MNSDIRSWISWVKMDNHDTGFSLERHLPAIGWAIAMIAFGFLILAFDTRPVPPRYVFLTIIEQAIFDT